MKYVRVRKIFRSLDPLLSLCTHFTQPISTGRTQNLAYFGVVRDDGANQDKGESRAVDKGRTYRNGN